MEPHNRQRSCTRLCDGKQEVKAYAWEAFAQGSSIQAMSFYGIAVVNVAKEAAGCIMGEACNNKIYGIKAESILTALGAVAGLFAAIAMPFFGAVVDHTKYRRGVALWTTIIVIISNAIKVILSEETLLFCVILMSLTIVVLQGHLVTVNAYFRDFTDDENRLGAYMGLFIALRSLSSLVTMCLVIGFSKFLPIKPQYSYSVYLAKLAMLVDVFLSSICFVPSFLHRGFLPRPAQSKSTNNLLKSAYTSLYKSTKDVAFRENSSLKWFLLSVTLVCCSQAATGALAISYMLNYLQMNSIQININVFLINLTKIFGSIAYRVLCKRVCNLKAFKIAILLFSIFALLAGIVLKGPQHIFLMYIFTCLWGICSGWILPNMRTIFVSIIPAVQQAQYMGIYFFFAIGFTWIPNLMATLMINVFDLSWSVVLTTFSAYTWLALITLHFMGNYDAAKQYALVLSETTEFSNANDDDKIDLEKDMFNSTTTEVTVRGSIVTNACDGDSDISAAEKSSG